MTEFQKQAIREIFPYLPDGIVSEVRDYLTKNSQTEDFINEIRMWVGRPAVAMTQNGHFWLSEGHNLRSEELQEIFERVCGYAVYSHRYELSQGYVTLPGGHRVGIGGEAASDRDGYRTIRSVTSLNFRIACSFPGCADSLAAALFTDGLCGALLVGPPCSGKTTLLRDLARRLSSPPYWKKVTVVDERGELAAVFRGEATRLPGMFCDVLTGYPKGEGIVQAVRTLSPEIIICDEIGDPRDAAAVREGVNAGVCLLASIHARQRDELSRRPAFRVLKQTGAFRRIVWLKDGRNRCQWDSITEVSP